MRVVGMRRLSNLKILKTFSSFLLSHKSLFVLFSAVVSMLLWKPSADSEFSEETLRHDISTGSVVIEVGANKGGLTILLSDIVGQEGHVYSLEPNPFSYELLRRFTRNRKNVSIFNVGAGTRTGKVKLDISGTSDKGATMIRRSNLDTLTIEIKLVSLDDLMCKKRISRVNAVVIDAEGAEAEVLSGSSMLLSQDVEMVIYVEVHPKLREGGIPIVDQIMASFDFNRSEVMRERDTVLFRYCRKFHAEASGSGQGAIIVGQPPTTGKRSGTSPGAPISP